MSMQARKWLAPWLALSLMLIAVNSPATQITIVNNDGPGEGFNDTTPVAPVGNNPGTTLGEQRLIVFREAAKIWESIIDSNVEIRVEAQFDPLTCSSGSGVLGSAGANDIYRFGNAPSQPWYPIALANSISGTDLDVDADIGATFNSDVDDNPGCLTGFSWYYGIDGIKPSQTFGLFTVVMHEIGHGLGFQTFVNTATGSRFNNRDDVFMLNLEDHSLGQTWDQLNDAGRVTSATDTNDLHWNGANVLLRIGDLSNGVDQGHVKMYAPGTLSQGSSVSHFDTSLSPNELMEHQDTGAKTGPSLAKELLQDIGWTIFPTSKPVISIIADGSTAGTTPHAASFTVADDDTALASLALSATSSNLTLVDAGSFSFSGSGRVRGLQVTPLVGASGSVDIDVTVSDGSTIDTETFTLVINTAPVVSIVSPTDGDGFLVSTSINFQGTASDVEDGDLSSSIQWISSIDTSIGTGSSFSTALSEGTHLISASVTDNNSSTAVENITIHVYGSGDSDTDGIEDGWEFTFFGNLNRDGTGDFDTDGLNDLDEFNAGTLPDNADTDGDTFSDGDEVAAGTDPTDPASFPILNAPLLGAPALLTLSLLLISLGVRRLKR